MRELLRTPATTIWLLLVAATGVSWTLGTDHGLGATAASLVIIAVAVVKVRWIGLYFMELRDAPPVLRGLFEGYVAVVGTALLVIYLVA